MKKLPCPIDTIDEMKEMYLEGTNVLIAEVDAAMNIPENKRRLIDTKYLEAGVDGTPPPQKHIKEDNEGNQQQ